MNQEQRLTLRALAILLEGHSPNLEITQDIKKALAPTKEELESKKMQKDREESIGSETSSNTKQESGK